MLRDEDGTAELEVQAGLASSVHTHGKICVGMCVHAEMNEPSGETLFAKGEKKTSRQRNVACGVYIQR